MSTNKRDADNKLRELGCINKFYQEFYNQHQHINFEVEYGMIDRSLDWSETEDGSNYWNRIDDEFNDWFDNQ